MISRRTIHCFIVVAVSGLTTAQAADYSWQQAHAKVLPTGDLQWEPKPFVFTAGDEVRYIDFYDGDDQNDGLTKQTPWKHHPWDKAFKGDPESDARVDTYIFKRGVVYRGSLTVTRGGAAGQPIRLTSDPSWGEGEAVLAGSELATGWKQGADRDDIPNGEKVWYTDTNTKSRAVWMVDAEGRITPIALARTPNWNVSDPDDVMSEWYTWKNDEWWLDGMKNQAQRIRQGGKEYQLGIDPENLKGDLEQYRDATVWTEWGVVMGTPYPTRVVDVIPDKNALVYDGVFYNIWGQIAGHRYFLEDRPQFLDAAGEYWLDEKGRGGRLYIRLPGDIDPNTVRIETAARTTMIDAKGMSHLDISGLTFRFGNIPWSYWGYPFGSADNMGVACIRLLGPTTDIKITNCSFEHIPRAIRIVGSKYAENIDRIDIEDCTFREIDQSAVHIYSDSFPDARVGEVNFRRNHLRRITLRAQKNTHCHAVYVQRLERGEFAGNFLERLYAGGIFIEGAKGSGDGGEAPLTRILIHHNKVIDPLLASCDWGGIEQNQGGPAYIYDNVVGNPGGLHYWKYLNQDPNKPAEGTLRFGHAYYIDGSFKKYLFNNIAWGKNNELGSKYANCSGLQEIIGFENAAFNNTFYKFVQASRRQAPQAGRNKYLGNVFDDVSQFVFRHSDAKQQDANAQDAGEAAKLCCMWSCSDNNGIGSQHVIGCLNDESHSPWTLRQAKRSGATHNRSQVCPKRTPGTPGQSC